MDEARKGYTNFAAQHKVKSWWEFPVNWKTASEYLFPSYGILDGLEHQMH